MFCFLCFSLFVYTGCSSDNENSSRQVLVTNAYNERLEELTRTVSCCIVSPLFRRDDSTELEFLKYLLLLVSLAIGKVCPFAAE